MLSTNRRLLIVVLAILGLLLSLQVLGCASLANRGDTTSTSLAEPDDGGQEVQGTLYFSDSQASKLLAETREFVQSTEGREGLVMATVEQLTEGPREEGHYKTIPDESELLDVKIEDTLLMLDFNHEFQENSPGGSAGEIITVYSLVNTLTELPFVEKVEFLIEGEPISTLAGHLDLTQPVARDSSLIAAEDE